MLRAAAVIPPTVLFEASTISTPLKVLATALVPLTSVPMKLPATRLPVALPWMNTPSWALPEMTLRSPAVVPPIVLFDASMISTPSYAFPRAFVPVTLVPMKLPATRLPVALPWMNTPSWSLPEMTLRSPAVVPPIVLFDALSAISTPERELPRGMVPVTSLPM